MNDIDKIKELLFRNEKKALDAITRRLETPESRTADISDVLPESILRSHADKRLVRAMQEPVEQCLKQSIRQNPKEFADVLFPVIGPAIRKSIAESLRTAMQSLNQAIESSLSVGTRIKAWRAGVPLGQYILQRNIVYRVEQAFLIKRHDGLLIEHAQHESVLSKDSDAVSAMFTAIQDFIRDSFSGGGGGSLSTAEVGDVTLWAVDGPHAILVCVIRGVAPADLRNEMREILEQVHLRHGEALSAFDGGAAPLGVEQELEQCLVLEQQVEGATGDDSSGLPLPAMILGAALLLLLGWWWFHNFTEQRRLDSFRAALDSTPGIVVNEIYREHGQVVVRGLRDPLSGSPSEIAPGSHIDPAELRLELAPYQSLDTAIVERRARRILKPPTGVGLVLEGNRLRLSGSAPAEWKHHAESLAVALPGVDVVDTSRMARNDVELLGAARERLQPPDSVQLMVKDGVLGATGTAPLSWLQEAARQLPSVAGLRASNLQGIAVEERVRLAELLTVAGGTKVYFARNDILMTGQDAVLDRLAFEMRQIVALAGQLDLTPEIRIRGFADGTGAPEANRIVRMARAQRVAQRLIDGGVPSSMIQLQVAEMPLAGGEDEALRRAEVTVGVVTAR